MLDEIKRDIYNLSRDVRNLERLIKSDTFTNAYSAASQSEKMALECLIQGCCDSDSKFRENCESSIRGEIRRLNLADSTIRELRDKAQSLGIKGWSRKSKDVLLSEIYQDGNGTNLSKGH